MPRYANIIYNGYWWSPERRLLQELIDASQEHVNGSVRLKLFKGNVIMAGRRSETDSLFDERIARPSRRTRAPTIRKTPRASSSSTPCACASRHGASLEGFS